MSLLFKGAFVGKEKRDGESFEWAVVQKAIELEMA